MNRLYPSDSFAVNWPGHKGLYLHNKQNDMIYILDPLDSIDGQYKVLDAIQTGTVR